MPKARHTLDSHEFLELSARQELVVSRDQLAEHGADRHVVSRRVARGAWDVLGPYIVVLRPGPLSRKQQLWTAVLHGGDRAALCRLSALEAAGFAGFSDDAVSVCIPHGSNRLDLETGRVTVHVHESRNLPAEQVLRQMSPPRMRQDRATVDAASAAISDRACRTIVAMAVQQRLATPAALQSLVLPRSNLPRRALILETIGDVAGGSESLPELEYLQGLRRFKIPLPSRQRRLVRADGRYYLDAEFDPWAVTVEINGAQHLDVRHKEADDVRRSQLAIGGRLVVDIGSHIVRHDIELAVLLTADALMSRGWEPDQELRRDLVALAQTHPTFIWTTDVAA